MNKLTSYKIIALSVFALFATMTFWVESASADLVGPGLNPISPNGVGPIQCVLERFNEDALEANPNDIPACKLLIRSDGTQPEPDCKSRQLNFQPRVWNAEFIYAATDLNRQMPYQILLYDCVTPDQNHCYVRRANGTDTRIATQQEAESCTDYNTVFNVCGGSSRNVRTITKGRFTTARGAYTVWTYFCGPANENLANLECFVYRAPGDPQVPVTPAEAAAGRCIDLQVTCPSGYNHIYPWSRAVQLGSRWAFYLAYSCNDAAPPPPPTDLVRRDCYFSVNNTVNQQPFDGNSLANAWAALLPSTVATNCFTSSTDARLCGAGRPWSALTGVVRTTFDPATLNGNQSPAGRFLNYANFGTCSSGEDNRPRRLCYYSVNNNISVQPFDEASTNAAWEALLPSTRRDNCFTNSGDARLCGAGSSWTLLRGAVEVRTFPVRENFSELVSDAYRYFAAFGTCSAVVPPGPTVRTACYYGLAADITLVRQPQDDQSFIAARNDFLSARNNYVRGNRQVSECVRYSTEICRTTQGFDRNVRFDIIDFTNPSTHDISSSITTGRAPNSEHSPSFGYCIVNDACFFRGSVSSGGSALLTQCAPAPVGCTREEANEQSPISAIDATTRYRYTNVIQYSCPELASQVCYYSVNNTITEQPVGQERINAAWRALLPETQQSNCFTNPTDTRLCPSGATWALLRGNALVPVSPTSENVTNPARGRYRAVFGTCSAVVPPRPTVRTACYYGLAADITLVRQPQDNQSFIAARNDFLSARNNYVRGNRQVSECVRYSTEICRTTQGFDRNVRFDIIDFTNPSTYDISSSVTTGREPNSEHSPSFGYCVVNDACYFRGSVGGGTPSLLNGCSTQPVGCTRAEANTQNPVSAIDATTRYRYTNVIQYSCPPQGTTSCYFAVRDSVSSQPTSRAALTSAFSFVISPSNPTNCYSVQNSALLCANVPNSEWTSVGVEPTGGYQQFDPVTLNGGNLQENQNYEAILGNCRIRQTSVCYFVLNATTAVRSQPQDINDYRTSSRDLADTRKVNQCDTNQNQVCRVGIHASFARDFSQSVSFVNIAPGQAQSTVDITQELVAGATSGNIHVATFGVCRVPTECIIERSLVNIGRDSNGNRVDGTMCSSSAPPCRARYERVIDAYDASSQFIYRVRAYSCLERRDCYFGVANTVREQPATQALLSSAFGALVPGTSQNQADCVSRPTDAALCGSAGSWRQLNGNATVSFSPVRYDGVPVPTANNLEFFPIFGGCTPTYTQTCRFAVTGRYNLTGRGGRSGRPALDSSESLRLIGQRVSGRPDQCNQAVSCPSGTSFTPFTFTNERRYATSNPSELGIRIDSRNVVLQPGTYTMEFGVCAAPSCVISSPPNTFPASGQPFDLGNGAICNTGCGDGYSFQERGRTSGSGYLSSGVQYTEVIRQTCRLIDRPSGECQFAIDASYNNTRAPIGTNPQVSVQPGRGEVSTLLTRVLSVSPATTCTPQVRCPGGSLRFVPFSGEAPISENPRDEYRISGQVESDTTYTLTFGVCQQDSCVIPATIRALVGNAPFNLGNGPGCGSACGPGTTPGDVGGNLGSGYDSRGINYGSVRQLACTAVGVECMFVVRGSYNLIGNDGGSVSFRIQPRQNQLTNALNAVLTPFSNRGVCNANRPSCPDNANFQRFRGTPEETTSPNSLGINTGITPGASHRLIFGHCESNTCYIVRSNFPSDAAPHNYQGNCQPTRSCATVAPGVTPENVTTNSDDGYSASGVRYLNAELYDCPNAAPNPPRTCYIPIGAGHILAGGTAFNGGTQPTRPADVGNYIQAAVAPYVSTTCIDTIQGACSAASGARFTSLNGAALEIPANLRTFAGSENFRDIGVFGVCIYPTTCNIMGSSSFSNQPSGTRNVLIGSSSLRCSPTQACTPSNTELSYPNSYDTIGYRYRSTIVYSCVTRDDVRNCQFAVNANTNRTRGPRASLQPTTSQDVNALLGLVIQPGNSTQCVQTAVCPSGSNSRFIAFDGDAFPTTRPNRAFGIVSGTRDEQDHTLQFGTCRATSCLLPAFRIQGQTSPYNLGNYCGTSQCPETQTRGEGTSSRSGIGYGSNGVQYSGIFTFPCSRTPTTNDRDRTCYFGIRYQQHQFLTYPTATGQQGYENRFNAAIERTPRGGCREESGLVCESDSRFSAYKVGPVQQIPAHPTINTFTYGLNPTNGATYTLILGSCATNSVCSIPLDSYDSAARVVRARDQQAGSGIGIIQTDGICNRDSQGNLDNSNLCPGGQASVQPRPLAQDSRGYVITVQVFTCSSPPVERNTATCYYALKFPHGFTSPPSGEAAINRALSATSLGGLSARGRCDENRAQACPSASGTFPLNQQFQYIGSPSQQGVPLPAGTINNPRENTDYRAIFGFCQTSNPCYFTDGSLDNAALTNGLFNTGGNCKIRSCGDGAPEPTNTGNARFNGFRGYDSRGVVYPSLVEYSCDRPEDICHYAIKARESLSFRNTQPLNQADYNRISSQEVLLAGETISNCELNPNNVCSPSGSTRFVPLLGNRYAQLLNSQIRNFTPDASLSYYPQFGVCEYTDDCYTKSVGGGVFNQGQIVDRANCAPSPVCPNGEAPSNSNVNQGFGFVDSGYRYPRTFLFRCPSDPDPREASICFFAIDAQYGIADSSGRVRYPQSDAEIRSYLANRPSGVSYTASACPTRAEVCGNVNNVLFMPTGAVGFRPPRVNPADFSVTPRISGALHTFEFGFCTYGGLSTCYIQRPVDLPIQTNEHVNVGQRCVDPATRCTTVPGNVVLAEETYRSASDQVQRGSDFREFRYNRVVTYLCAPPGSERKICNFATNARFLYRGQPYTDAEVTQALGALVTGDPRTCDDGVPDCGTGAVFKEFTPEITENSNSRAVTTGNIFNINVVPAGSYHILNFGYCERRACYTQNLQTATPPAVQIASDCNDDRPVCPTGQTYTAPDPVGPGVDLSNGHRLDTVWLYRCNPEQRCNILQRANQAVSVPPSPNQLTGLLGQVANRFLTECVTEDPCTPGRGFTFDPVEATVANPHPVVTARVHGLQYPLGPRYTLVFGVCATNTLCYVKRADPGPTSLGLYFVDPIEICTPNQDCDPGTVPRNNALGEVVGFTREHERWNRVQFYTCVDEAPTTQRTCRVPVKIEAGYTSQPNTVGLVTTVFSQNLVGATNGVVTSCIEGNPCVSPADFTPLSTPAGQSLYRIVATDTTARRHGFSPAARETLMLQFGVCVVPTTCYVEMSSRGTPNSGGLYAIGTCVTTRPSCVFATQENIAGYDSRSYSYPNVISYTCAPPGDRQCVHLWPAESNSLPTSGNIGTCTENNLCTAETGSFTPFGNRTRVSRVESGVTVFYQIQRYYCASALSNFCEIERTNATQGPATTDRPACLNMLDIRGTCPQGSPVFIGTALPDTMLEDSGLRRTITIRAFYCRTNRICFVLRPPTRNTIVASAADIPECILNPRTTMECNTPGVAETPRVIGTGPGDFPRDLNNYQITAYWCQPGGGPGRPNVETGIDATLKSSINVLGSILSAESFGDGISQAEPAPPTVREVQRIALTGPADCSLVTNANLPQCRSIADRRGSSRVIIRRLLNSDDGQAQSGGSSSSSKVRTKRTRTSRIVGRRRASSAGGSSRRVVRRSSASARSGTRSVIRGRRVLRRVGSTSYVNSDDALNSPNSATVCFGRDGQGGVVRRVVTGQCPEGMEVAFSEQAAVSQSTIAKNLPRKRSAYVIGAISGNSRVGNNGGGFTRGFQSVVPVDEEADLKLGFFATGFGSTTTSSALVEGTFSSAEATGTSYGATSGVLIKPNKYSSIGLGGIFVIGNTKSTVSGSNRNFESETLGYGALGRYAYQAGQFDLEARGAVLLSNNTNKLENSNTESKSSDILAIGQLRAGYNVLGGGRDAQFQLKPFIGSSITFASAGETQINTGTALISAEEASGVGLNAEGGVTITGQFKVAEGLSIKPELSGSVSAPLIDLALESEATTVPLNFGTPQTVNLKRTTNGDLSYSVAPKINVSVEDFVTFGVGYNGTFTRNSSTHTGSGQVTFTF